MDHKNPNTKRTSKMQDGFLLAGILKIAAAAQVILSEASQEVYLEQLAGMAEEAFQFAATRTIREWDKPNMMPPIAFILARCETNPQLASEAAWETLQRLIYRDWHPDIGWLRDVELDLQMEYAIRQCGGMHRIHDCPIDNFNFLRKDFLAAHARFDAEGGAQLRLSEKQADQIYGRLVAEVEGKKRKELPS